MRDADNIAAVAATQGRIVGASDKEIGAAVEIAQQVVRHEVIKTGAEAMLSGRCRRESPVTLKLKDDVLIEGVVDLAYQDPNRENLWVVVDYKTDYEIRGRLEEYKKQVWLYALAISRATGMKTQPVLLRI